MYDENDYEFNEIMILKKVTVFLVNVALGVDEPNIEALEKHLDNYKNH